MGKCYSYKQDYEIALNEYLTAHRYDANKTEAIKEIIKINEASGDKTSLMEFYEKLVRQEPDNTFALVGLGDVYADLYEFKNAIEYYEKAVKTNNAGCEVYYKLGNCCEKLRDTVSAKEMYEKYLAKAPQSPDAEKLKEKLAEMDVSSSVSASADEGFIDKIMKFFGR